ncbi:MarP family serine protease [Mycolicibacterium phlei]|uniref:MarP family serine protease n=2 Tax=Mycolicibacterium phlei TaxID=1771 RepID=UPI00025AEB3B|nr:MarP family serine protease [Mycolicibacterium phlei]EID16542.1 trypsin-like serine protease with C-terminal PDZ domain [Mycolicibacterium phlei RIVM601174]MBF4192831.1 trypsin-like serine protease with C-terminal PDZ domain [Mycolicibacterium phlei]
MTPRALAACLALVAASIAGCGTASQPADTSSPEPTVVSVAPPDPALAESPVVADAARSVVKVHAISHACQRSLEGSGVVVAPNKVMSAAHAVAGSDSVTVHVGDEERSATVVVFDPDMDIAVLDVPELTAPPMGLAEKPATTGTDVLVLGYPGGGPFTATPARIRDIIELQGPDIYNTKTVTREVYSIRGSIRQGDSGGPLIGMDRRVLGIGFGAAIGEPETGFALTAKEVFGLMMRGVAATEPVPTGECVKR